MKRGLKSCPIRSQNRTLVVKEDSPMKRGLKYILRPINDGLHVVKEDSPMKRGLKFRGKNRGQVRGPR